MVYRETCDFFHFHDRIIPFFSLKKGCGGSVSILTSLLYLPGRRLTSTLSDEDQEKNRKTPAIRISIRTVARPTCAAVDAAGVNGVYLLLRKAHEQSWLSAGKEITDMMLYIVRHGETDWNRQKKVQGHTGYPLE